MNHSGNDKTVFISERWDFIGNMPGPPAVTSLEPLWDSRSSLHLLLNLFQRKGLTRDMSPHRLCEGDTWLDGCRHTVDHCVLPLNRRCVGESCPSPHLETTPFASSVADMTGFLASSQCDRSSANNKSSSYLSQQTCSFSCSLAQIPLLLCDSSDLQVAESLLESSVFLRVCSVRVRICIQ